MFLRVWLSDCSVCIHEKSLEEVRKSVLSRCDEVRSLAMSSHECATLRSASHHLQTTVSLMKAITSTTQSPTFPARKRPAPTKRMEIQPRYFSTKKKKRTAATLAKPTAIQTTDIKNPLFPKCVLFV